MSTIMCYIIAFCVYDLAFMYSTNGTTIGLFCYFCIHSSTTAIHLHVMLGLHTALTKNILFC